VTSDHIKPLGERLLALAASYRSTPPGAGSGGWLKRGVLRGLAVTQPWQVFVAAGLAGMCGTAVVGLLSASTGDLAGAPSHIRSALLFILVLLIYRQLQRVVLRSASSAVEQALDRQRTRMAGKVARLDLRGYESIAREQLQGGLERYFASVSGATIEILQGVQALVLLSLSLCYLATLSLSTALLIGVVIALMGMVYRRKEMELTKRLGEAAAAESALAVSVEELLDGFKELRLNGTKRAAVLEQIRTQSTRSTDERIISAEIFADLIVFGNSVAYLLAGAVIFVLPLFSSAAAQAMSSLVAVVLFLIGPVGGLISAAKQLATAQFAVSRLADFEDSIDRLLQAAPSSVERPDVPFRRIEAKGVHYTHRPQGGEAPFAIGPLDFQLDAGEVVFVTGGNGSGKTTALRVLIGLYTPDAGELLLNNEPLARDGSDMEAYRRTFGAVFADVHIFRRLYGLPADRLQQLRRYLVEFDLLHKLPNDLAAGFDPEALSTGQRKRLALAIAIAEDRPVLILDEWAADQDPQSRERFYRHVLPQLREAGKTVLAITHDDRYFNTADRRYHMEDGRMTLVASR
jgi:putative ATP-binding cassette transporter